MSGDNVEECKARLSELKHIKNFINVLINERKKELKQAGEKK